MALTQNNSNRPDIKIVEAIASSPNIESFNIRSGALTNTIDSFIPAVFSGVSGFVAGATAGALVFDNSKPESLALAGVLGWASYNLSYFLDRWLATPRYSSRWWDDDDQMEPEPDFVQTGEGRGHLRLLSREDKKLVTKFARHYPDIQRLSINPWENGPMTRAEITRLREKILPNLKAIRREGRRVFLNDYGKNMLSEWAAGKFQPPPPPDGRPSPAQE